ncbi:hypothetical protein PARMER_02593 [Parabacteroides merdae ATCC 43184]|nr:hypothetical protein PARMER_02593 [Parabacteroides merdae ATCC 43184]
MFWKGVSWVSIKTYRFFAIFATFSRIFRFFFKLYHYG